MLRRHRALLQSSLGNECAKSGLARRWVTRTITNYLTVLEISFVAHVVRRYSTGKIAEIVAAPKVYGFDTGFVCYFRGWHHARPDDLGLLWEQLRIE